MQDILATAFCTVLLLLYLYFGYRDDYRRNPKQFWRIIVGVSIGCAALFLAMGTFTNLPTWWGIIAVFFLNYVAKYSKQWIHEAEEK